MRPTIVILLIMLFIVSGCAAHKQEQPVNDYIVTEPIPSAKPTLSPTPQPTAIATPAKTAKPFAAALSKNDIATAKRFIIEYYNSLDGWTRFDINTVTMLVASDNYSLYTAGNADYTPGLAIILYFAIDPDDETSPKWYVLLERDTVDSEWRVVNQGH